MKLEWNAMLYTNYYNTQKGIILGNPHDHIQTTIPNPAEQELLCHKAGVQEN